MADAALSQTSFLGGEWSLRMQGRFDRPDYRTALNVCLNSFPTETGTWTRRPGTQFGGTTRNGAAARLIKFDFQANAAYQVEFTNGHMRFWSRANLVTTNDGNPVINISGASPAVVQLSAASTWATGDQGYFLSLGTTAPTLQNRPFALTRISATQFAIADAITGAAIDGSTVGWVATGGAVMVRAKDIATSYTSGSWATLRLVQAETTAYLLNGAVPQLLTATPPVGADFATFSLSTNTNTCFQDGPYLDPGTTATIQSSLTIQGDGSYVIGGGAAFPDARATGLVAADVGRHVRLMNEPPPWPGPGLLVAGALYTTYGGKGADATLGTYWVCNDAASVTYPGTNLTDWTPVAPQTAIVWTWGIIASVVSALQFTLTLKGPALIYSGAGVLFNTWRLGVYSNAMGWPTCGVYHEGRLWLAGAIPNRIDSSMSNRTDLFSPTDSSGAVLANSGISYIFNASDVNPIFWMIQDLQGIICGTKAGEWLVQSPATGPLSATNIAARRVTKIGCAAIEPRRTEHTLLFAQSFGRKVMEYFADIYSGKFSGPHASFTWKHLTAGGIDEIAYQQELIPMLWLRVAGTLRSAVYKRDTLTTAQGPTISAGARHTLGSGRTVESISVGPSVGGNYDSLSMVTNDVSGVRHVEVLTDLLDEGAASSSAWFLDDAVRPSSTTTTSAASASLPYGGMTLNGLWHLNGKTVQVWAGGVDCGNRGDNLTTFTDFVVANGSVTVPYGDGVSAGSGAGQFTPALAAAAAAASTIVVGFTYNSDGQIVRPATPAESGARSGPALAKTRRVDKYGLQVESTAGLAIGTSFANLKPVLFKDAAGNTLAPNVIFSGITRDSLGDDYSFDGMVCWRIARPYPASVVALAGFLSTQDG